MDNRWGRRYIVASVRMRTVDDDDVVHVVVCANVNPDASTVTTTAGDT